MTRILTMHHGTVHVRILTPMHGSNGNREDGSTATLAVHVWPPLLGRCVPLVRPCAVVTVSIVHLKAEHCRAPAMTRPFLSSRRSLAAEAVVAQAPGCVWNQPGHC